MIYLHFASFRRTFPARASEWALAFVLFNWAMVLNLNAGLFEQPSFRGLASFASQQTWFWMCLAVGGGRVVVLTINGAWRRSPHLRAFGAILSVFFWYQITVGMFQSGTFGTGLAVYPVLLLLDVYNAIRAMGEAGTVDREAGQHRNEPHG